MVSVGRRAAKRSSLVLTSPDGWRYAKRSAALLFQPRQPILESCFLPIKGVSLVIVHVYGDSSLLLSVWQRWEISVARTLRFG